MNAKIESQHEPRLSILTVTNMYPSERRPTFGIFVREQVEQYRHQYPEVPNQVFMLPGRGFRRYFLSAFPLAARLIGFRPSVIHVHFGLTMLPIIALFPLILILQCKIVLTLHGTDALGKNKTTRAVSQLGMHLSTTIICVSQQIYDLVRESNSLGRKAVWIPCGVAQLFADSVDAGQTGTRKPVVIFPSSPERPEKNYARFEKIISLVSESGPIEFEIVILENMNREQIRDLFMSSACLLLTSDYEGSPQVVKEAMFCGLPVISTQVGDVAHLVGHYHQCEVSDDLSVLAMATRRQLETPASVSYSESDLLEIDNWKICQKINAIYQTCCS